MTYPRFCFESSSSQAHQRYDSTAVMPNSSSNVRRMILRWSFHPGWSIVELVRDIGNRWVVNHFYYKFSIEPSIQSFFPLALVNARSNAFWIRYVLLTCFVFQTTTAVRNQEKLAFEILMQLLCCPQCLSESPFIHSWFIPNPSRKGENSYTIHTSTAMSNEREA